MTMWKRAVALAATGLALTILHGPHALAGIRSDPAWGKGVIRTAAVLDPTFAGDGLVTLRGEAEGWAAYGAATQNGDLIVSGGLTTRLLTSSGDPAEIFGGAATLDPSTPEGVEFLLSDFTLDSQGRLLIVGTASSPKNEDEGPYGPNGAPLPIVPSAVRILRILPNGRPDPTFGQSGVLETDLDLPPPRDEHGGPLQPEASIDASGIAVDSQGRIVLTGSAEVGLGPSCVHDIFEPVAVSAAYVARLTENGALDPSFGRGGLVGGRKPGENPLRAESIGKPIVGPRGEITYRSTRISACWSDHGRWGVAQLTPDGRTREALGRKGAVGGYFTALAGAPDGSVIALARMPWTEGEAFRARVIRITRAGKVDRSFGQQGQTVVKLGSVWGNEPDSLAVDAQGRILLGGTLVTRKRRSILLVRLRTDGRQEMNFGPNGRVATSFPGLVSFGPSDVFFDSKGRAVTVHRYETRKASSGLVLARYRLRR